jgi:hypothetical protein
MERWKWEREKEGDRNAYLKEKWRITRYRPKKRIKERI